MQDAFRATDEAIQIMQDLDARAAVAIHWGTFKLTDEPRDDPALEDQHHDDDGDGDGIKSPNILQNCRNPRSMLCFDSREGDTPGEDIGTFLQKHIASGHLLQLKVLDLEHVFRPQLPKNIGKLIYDYELQTKHKNKK